MSIEGPGKGAAPVAVAAAPSKPILDRFTDAAHQFWDDKKVVAIREEIMLKIDAWLPYIATAGAIVITVLHTVHVIVGLAVGYYLSDKPISIGADIKNVSLTDIYTGKDTRRLSWALVALVAISIILDPISTAVATGVIGMSLFIAWKQESARLEAETLLKANEEEAHKKKGAENDPSESTSAMSSSTFSSLSSHSS